MDVTDDTGKVVKWAVEFAGLLNLSEVGWTAESIKAGERVTVTGNPTHTPSPRMAFRRLVRSDGTVLLPAGPQRLNAIEEEHRERAASGANRSRRSPSKSGTSSIQIEGMRSRSHWRVGCSFTWLRGALILEQNSTSLAPWSTATS